MLETFPINKRQQKKLIIENSNTTLK